MENTDNKANQYTEMQQHEATLHWQRNNYFLVTMSIFLVSMSQFKDDTRVTFIISLAGLVISAVWGLVNDRSSRLMGYWKKEEIKEGGKPYSGKAGGIPMRYLGYSIPIIFILLWLVLLILPPLKRS
jgi:hypothetical protein